jgi:predicted permease
MIRPSIKGQRLVTLFLLGCLLFNYPLLSLFAGQAEILGIPLLYGYVFLVWALLIGLMALAVEKKND